MTMRVKHQPKEGLDQKKVLARTKRGGIKNLAHAGGAIRLTARRSIKRSKKAATPGSPPHTRKGQLRRAIVYAVEKDKQRVLIGPDHAVVGPSAAAHEFGGRFRGQNFRGRPFMGPALEQNRDRLPKMWSGSVK